MENVIEFKYNRTPLYVHSRNTDTWLLRSFLVPGESRYISSKFNPLNRYGHPVNTNMFSKVSINGICLYTGVFRVKTTNTSIHPHSSRKPYPIAIPDKNGQTLHPFKTETGENGYPFWGSTCLYGFYKGVPPGLIGVD